MYFSGKNKKNMEKIEGEKKNRRKGECLNGKPNS